MKHLDPDQLLELAERPPGADPHLRECERCRGAVATLRQALQEVAAVEVPEPSPLFWEHWSRRVSDAVRGEAAPPRVSRGLPWRLLASLAAAAVLVLVVALGWSAISREATTPSMTARVVSSSDDPRVREAGEDEDDEAWAVVAAVAEGVEAGTVEATGIAPTPGSVEEAASELSPAEREELIRLLRAETADPSGTEG